MKKTAERETLDAQKGQQLHAPGPSVPRSTRFRSNVREKSTPQANPFGYVADVDEPSTNLGFSFSIFLPIHESRHPTRHSRVRGSGG